VLLYSENETTVAMLRIVEVLKTVVEGAAATGLAACLYGKLDHLKGKKLVCVHVCVCVCMYYHSVFSSLQCCGGINRIKYRHTSAYQVFRTRPGQ